MQVNKMRKNNIILREKEFSEAEKLRVYLMMIAVGGFLGAYTFTLKGGVFCNAQTANFVLLAVQLGKGNFHLALYYFIPISAYLLGAVLSEFLPKYVNSVGFARWETFFIAIEVLCLLVLGFIPDSAPVQIFQVTVNFIASMQYNTFRAAQHVPMATTFCTNHLRQVGINIVGTARRDPEAKRRLVMHILMILSFVAGGIVSAFLCVRLGGRAIWGAVVLLIIVFADLLVDDLAGGGKNGSGE